MYRFFPEREDEDKQWDELMGIANRTDYDLRVHSKKPENAEGKRINPDSTEDLSYFDPADKGAFLSLRHRARRSASIARCSP